MEIEAGKTFTVKCPFVRSVFCYYDVDDTCTELSWKPGVEWEEDGFGDASPYAHGEGSVVYHVVDVHKLPRPYPARVFFTRKWIDPDGRSFGKGALRIMTVEAFRRRINGFRWAGFNDVPYEIVEFTDADRSRMLMAA